MVNKLIYFPHSQRSMFTKQLTRLLHDVHCKWNIQSDIFKLSNQTQAISHRLTDTSYTLGNCRGNKKQTPPLPPHIFTPKELLGSRCAPSDRKPWSWLFATCNVGDDDEADWLLSVRWWWWSWLIAICKVFYAKSPTHDMVSYNYPVTILHVFTKDRDKNITATKWLLLLLNLSVSIP